MKNEDISTGISDAAPILLAIVPFAAVFGALAIERGLTFGETLLASATIFAGASQYAMVDLMGQGVPPWSIVLTVFAINFRHVLYSASIGRHLGAFSAGQRALALFLMVDPVFASGERRATLSGLRPAYYFAYGAVVYATWMSSNVVGALFGGLIENPAIYGLDFILPLYFTGLILAFRSRPNFLPVLIVSGLCSLLAYFTIGKPVAYHHWRLGRPRACRDAEQTGRGGRCLIPSSSSSLVPRPPISRASAAISSSRASENSTTASPPRSTPSQPPC